MPHLPADRSLAIDVPPANANPSDATSGLRREPLLLLVLLAILAALFGAAGTLTRAFHAREQQLAQQWYDRGQSELAAGRSETAIGDFRSALLYERDNPDYRWSLAEALLNAKQYTQAEGYFLSLLESQPADGRANHELARVEASTGKIEDAVRYYQSAIYGVWRTNAAEHRLEARFELVHLLLDNHRNTEAEAQLVSLTADLPESAPTLIQVAEMFSSVGDHERAAALYERALRSEPRNLEALNGLATAEFNLGRYAAARQRLASVLQREPANESAAAMQRTSEAVLSLDPYARVAGPERRARVIRDFQVAKARLQQCDAVTAGTSAPMTADLQTLAARQSTLAPKITDRNLRDDPDLAQTAIDLSFAIERQAQSLCGPLTTDDDALLRIAATHAQ